MNITHKYSPDINILYLFFFVSMISAFRLTSFYIQLFYDIGTISFFIESSSCSLFLIMSLLALINEVFSLKYLNFFYADVYFLFYFGTVIQPSFSFSIFSRRQVLCKNLSHVRYIVKDK